MKRNLGGFGTIEMLLMVLAIAIIGGTGFYVWHAKQASDKSLSATPSSATIVKKNTASSFAACKAAAGSIMQETYPEVCVTKNGQHFTDTSQTAPAAPDTVSYLVIKEWGVRMTLPAALSDAYYALPSGPTYAFLGLKSLTALAPDCAPDKVSLGLIFRQTDAEYQTALADQQTNGKNIDNVSGDVHIGGYWYGYTSPQAGCVDASNSKATALYNIASPSLTFPQAEKTLEANPGS